MSDKTVRSCKDCPLFMKEDEPIRYLKRSLGVPLCSKYGHVLGKPGMTPRQTRILWQSFAKNCPSYGKERATPPIDVHGDLKLEVVLPIPELRTQTSTTTARDSCSTCTSCTKYVPDWAVAEEFGWTSGLCAAKGKLILSNRTIAEAKGCEYREYGKVRGTAKGLILLPEFSNALEAEEYSLENAYFKTKANFVDPRDYETDKKVTSEEWEKGIRAWRLIPSPEEFETGEVYLPIYRIERFSSEDQQKIPQTGDKEHPELYVDHFGGVYLAAVSWTELDETPMAWGVAGIGKTELFRHLSWLMQLPFERFSITGSSELDDLAGKMMYTPELGTYYHYGRLPIAWQKPCVMVIDEPNTGPPEVWQFLRPLTDNSKQLVLDMGDKQTPIERDLDCYLGLAANPAWDPKNVGTHQIGDADANRLFHVEIDLPVEKLEREIIQNNVRLDGWELSQDQLNTIMAIAKEIRGLCDEGTLPISWAIRPQIKVARALRWFTPVVAYRRAIADYLEPEVRSSLLDVVRSHIGNEWD